MVDFDLEVFHAIQIILLFLMQLVNHILPLVVVQIDVLGDSRVIFDGLGLFGDIGLRVPR